MQNSFLPSHEACVLQKSQNDVLRLPKNWENQWEARGCSHPILKSVTKVIEWIWRSANDLPLYLYLVNLTNYSANSCCSIMAWLFQENEGAGSKVAEEGGALARRRPALQIPAVYEFHAPMTMQQSKGRKTRNGAKNHQRKRCSRSHMAGEVKGGYLPQKPLVTACSFSEMPINKATVQPDSLFLLLCLLRARSEHHITLQDYQSITMQRGIRTFKDWQFCNFERWNDLQNLHVNHVRWGQIRCWNVPFALCCPHAWNWGLLISLLIWDCPWMRYFGEKNGWTQRASWEQICKTLGDQLGN